MTVTNALAQRPVLTRDGEVQPRIRDMLFGYRGGSHGFTPCWIYRRRGVDIEMMFGFYNNFTPDDLICKILTVNEAFHEGSGASLQFNGDVSTADDHGNVALNHSGLVTISSRLSRTDLVEAIRVAAPDVDNAFGGLAAEHGWPLRLGTTADVPALLDRLFLYTYAVEQAKRWIRKDPPLPALPGPLPPKAQAWIFQANPDNFDLDGYLRVTSAIKWTVRQRHLADRIAVGDRVFLWRAKGKGTAVAGIVAAGNIVELPRVQPEHEAARGFWHEAQAGEALRVRIQIERHAINAKEIIRRDWLGDDPVLRGLRILKMASETNYVLDPEQEHRLEALWRNTGRDWSESESIAGLWAYVHTLAGEISSKPGSPVADVALRIGRAATGVYNKVMNFRHLDPRDQRAGLSGGGDTDRKVWATFYDAEAQRLDTTRLDAEFAGRWPVGSDVEPDDIQPSAGGDRPALPRRRSQVQGYEPDPAVRRAVELWAMACAEEHYVGLGFTVENTATTKPYDFRCTRKDLEVRVEVKGSRGDATTVEVTIGEVENARGTGWRTDLFIVSQIDIVRSEEGPEASGGTACVVEGWKANPEGLSPTRFRCTVPAGSAAHVEVGGRQSGL